MAHTEEEQLEDIKRFWDDYGTAILLAVALVLAAFAGWRFWQKNHYEQDSLAANLFQDVMTSAQKLQTNPADTASNTLLQSKAQKLIQDYASTPYALDAALVLAKRASDTSDLKTAEKQLRWALDQKPEEGTRILVVTRLARILAAKGDYAGALALLDKESNPAFVPAVSEVRGDIFQAQGKIDDARKAYQAADAALKDRKQDRPILEMKMADVGLAPAPRDSGDDSKAAQQ